MRAFIKAKHILPVLTSLVWLACVILPPLGCAPPISVTPDSGLFCDRDDDCAIAWICRFHICQRPLELYTENPKDAGQEVSQPEEQGNLESPPWDGPCLTGTSRPCFTGRNAPQGECKSGEQLCKEGRWGICTGQILPTTEICNGHDDDCDGKIDNTPDKQTSLERPCKNQCGAGQQTCVNGVWQNCSASQPKAESCNGLDDDCDGEVDNHIQGPLCKRQDGVCAGSRKRCGGSKGWLECTETDYQTHSPGGYQPRETKCDGKDNDCDGQTDPSPQCSCKPEQTQKCYDGPPDTSAQSPCKAGLQKCESGKWSTCLGQRLPQGETCNGLDDDCDGKIDNQPKSDAPLGKSCQTPCGTGLELCKEGRWLACNAPSPKQEECNNKDDNCDGAIDEGISKPCKTSCGAGIISCKAGVWSACSASQPKTEECNGLDDDCNGKIDDLQEQPCTTACGAGKKRCVNGGWSACSAPQPKTEECNGLDDDCDGKTDEDLLKTCSTQCGTGQTRCVAGIWGKCPVPVPQPEICNGNDDDCDGKVDEDCYQSKSYSYTGERGFLPAISEDENFVGLLTYQGTSHLIQAGNGKIAGSQKGAMLTGLAFSPMKSSIPTGLPMMGLTGLDTLWTSQLWMYLPGSPPRLSAKLPLPGPGIPGDMHFDASGNALYVLESSTGILWKYELQNRLGQLTLNKTAIQLTTFTSSTRWTCKPLRFAVLSGIAAIACAGYSWSDIPTRATSLRSQPEPLQQAKLAFSQKAIMLVDLSQNGKLLSTHQLQATPLDVTMAIVNQKPTVFAVLAPNPKSSVAASLWTLTLPYTNTPTTISIPASNQKTRLRPSGVRMARSGVLAVALQEYANDSTYKLLGGRLALISLPMLLKGQWKVLQDVPLGGAPHYIESSTSGRLIAIAIPHSRGFDLTLLTGP